MAVAPEFVTNEKLRNLQNLYKDALEEARSIKAKAEQEERLLSSDELSQIDAALTRARNIRGEIDAIYRLMEEEKAASGVGNVNPILNNPGEGIDSENAANRSGSTLENSCMRCGSIRPIPASSGAT